jgi:pectinesterase
MFTPAVCFSRFGFASLIGAITTVAAATAACGGEGAAAPKAADAVAGGSSAAAGTSGSPAATSGGGAGVGAGGAIAAVGNGAAAGTSAGVNASGGTAAGGGPVAFEGTATRPQLTAALAADYTPLDYLKQAGPVAAPISDGWDPTAGIGDVAALSPRFRVAASGGTHTTVQAAVDAAVAVGGSDRIAIEVAPGTYREVVCVPSAAPPITLYSNSGDASATVIVFDNYNGKVKDAQTPANPCNAAIGATTYGTSGSPTFAAYAPEFQAKNLTFENDTDETGLSNNVQAVALSTQGDKQIYENVRLLGNQDTFYVKSSGADVIARVYVKGSFIQGDTDFIFGRATLVIDSSEIRFVSTRQGSKGYAVVPSTDARNPHGMLIYKSQFTADASTQAGQVHLGRAWDESGKDLATYVAQAATGIYPNGQALVRECTLGQHIRAADPWAEAATTKRPFSPAQGMYPENRLFELGNTGPGAAP